MEGKTAENMRSSGKMKVLIITGACILCALVLTLACDWGIYGSIFKIEMQGKAVAASPQGEIVATPGERSFISSFASDGGGGIYAATPSCRIDSYLGSQEEKSVVLWKSEDCGRTWTSQREVPDMVPSDYEVTEGIACSDGGVLISAKRLVWSIGMSREANLPHLYYISSSGEARCLEGVEDSIERIDLLRILGFVSEDRVLLAADDIEQGQGVGVADTAYLYDVAEDKLVAKCESGGLGLAEGFFMYDSASFVVFGADGAARFDAKTGKELPLDATLRDFLLQQWRGAGSSVVFCDEGLRVYCATLESLTCYDIGKGKTETVLEFDDVLFGSDGCFLDRGIVASDGDILLAYQHPQGKYLVCKIGLPGA